MRIFAYIFVIVFLSACADPLGLGSKPKPPSKKIMLLEGKDNFSNIKNPYKYPNLVGLSNAPMEAPMLSDEAAKGPNKPKNHFDLANRVPVFYNIPAESDFISLISQGGYALTVWALAPGNWLWSYRLIDSLTFGDARVWSLIMYPGNLVQIKNKLTKTCVTAYGTSTVHLPCDSANDSQFWFLMPFDNGAVQLMNFATNDCMSISFQSSSTSLGITMDSCIQPNQANIDRQWSISAPAMPAFPISITQ